MKKNVNFIALVFVVLSTVLLSCKKENFSDHAGPSICPSDKFAYIEEPSLNKTTINFALDTLKIRAKMNEEISWRIVVRGKTSKSFKKFSGYGSSITVDWRGKPDTLVFFQAEECEVEVYIACIEEKSIVKPFNITNISNFANQDYLVYNGDAGALGLGPYMYGTYAVHSTETSLGSPQGGNCHCITGNSSSTPVWYFGGLDFTVDVASKVLKDPEQVYFNCFVNVKGNSASVPTVSFKEGTITRSKFLYDMQGLTGWHFVSFKLSEADVVNPQDIVTVSYGVNAYPEQGTTGDLCFDFALFTNYEPFIKK